MKQPGCRTTYGASIQKCQYLAPKSRPTTRVQKFQLAFRGLVIIPVRVSSTNPFEIHSIIIVKSSSLT